MEELTPTAVIADGLEEAATVVDAVPTVTQFPRSTLDPVVTESPRAIEN